MGYIEIGKIVNTHALKGELKIESWSSFDDIRYQKGNTVYIQVNDEYIPFKVATYRTHKGYALVSFEGYQDINAVEKYKNHIVYIDEEDRQDLDEDEYYADELVGLSVIDENDQKIGEVISVEFTNGAQANLRVQRENNTDVLIPYVDAFIDKVDLDEEYIRIIVMDGLL